MVKPFYLTITAVKDGGFLWLNKKISKIYFPVKIKSFLGKIYWPIGLFK